MKKLWCGLGAAFFLSIALPAQEAPAAPADETYAVKINQKGDQFMQFTLLVALPIRPAPDKLLLGGEGTIGYLRFLTGEVAVGATLDFGYHATVGGNIFYYLPISAKVLYQATRGRMEFPLALSVGGAFENYLDRTYFGLYARPEFGAYYRFRPDWSIGAGVGASLMPQIYEDAGNNYLGVIADIGISGRYHF
jgi:hypothetical protein